MTRFLEESHYIDFNNEEITNLANELFDESMTDTEKAKAAYYYVRDEIPHSFDCNATVITAKASDVLKYRTGICHAKANLLAALLRREGIPTGFYFQYRTLAEDDEFGFCVHGLNAVYLEGRWILLDARGNKKGVEADFSLEEPKFAFPAREEYGEFDWQGIFAEPDKEIMQMLEEATDIQYIMDHIPDTLSTKPDINM